MIRKHKRQEPEKLVKVSHALEMGHLLLGRKSLQHRLINNKRQGLKSEKRKRKRRDMSRGEKEDERH